MIYFAKRKKNRKKYQVKTRIIMLQHNTRNWAINEEPMKTA